MKTDLQWLGHALTQRGSLWLHPARVRSLFPRTLWRVFVILSLLLGACVDDPTPAPLDAPVVEPCSEACGVDEGVYCEPAGHDAIACYCDAQHPDKERECRL